MPYVPKVFDEVSYPNQTADSPRKHQGESQRPPRAFAFGKKNPHDRASCACRNGHPPGSVCRTHRPKLYDEWFGRQSLTSVVVRLRIIDLKRCFTANARRSHQFQ
jgi:hypothetical protein